MISWWSIEFLDAYAGQTGYLKYNRDSGLAEGVFFEDGTPATGEYTYTTVAVDVAAPSWA